MSPHKNVKMCIYIYILYIYIYICCRPLLGPRHQFGQNLFAPIVDGTCWGCAIYSETRMIQHAFTMYHLLMSKGHPKRVPQKE